MVIRIVQEFDYMIYYINLKDYHKITLLNDRRHFFRILLKELFKHKQNAMATATIHRLTREKGRIVLGYEDYIYTLERKTNVKLIFSMSEQRLQR